VTKPVIDPTPPKAWYDPTTGQLCFRAAWEQAVASYGDDVAWWRLGKPITYRTLHDLALACETPSSPVWIDGYEIDWLVQALASWLRDKAVVFYDSARLRPNLSATEIDALPPGTHAIYFTSGTTGTPKAIVRSTAFALREAWAYAQDLAVPQGSRALALVYPWFGALTKHNLGMLLSGTAQVFAQATDAVDVKANVLYCTPSQALALRGDPTWDLISLTGEPISDHHRQHLCAMLTPDGRVLDAFGSTECGVIARRWLDRAALAETLDSFAGEVLPGKSVTVDKQKRLSVTLFDNRRFFTGDLAALGHGKLKLLGRSTALRKIHGIWHDSTPVLKALRNHPDIAHVALAPKGTEQQQLIVRVACPATLALANLESWLLENVSDLCLFPVIECFHSEPTLGPTGKRQFCGTPSRVSKARSMAVLVADIVLGQLPLPDSSPIRKTTFDALGVDSLDLTQVAIELETRTGAKVAESLLPSDTPCSIAQRLSRDLVSPFELRELARENGMPEVICLGRSLVFTLSTLSPTNSFKFSPCLRAQNDRFTIASLATNLLDSNPQLLERAVSTYIIGFSLDAVLAIELAFVLESQGQAVGAVFLLDPPTRKRRSWLRIRTPILGEWLTRSWFRYRPSFARELRRRAIALQPTRRINAPVTVLHRGEADCCWLDQQTLTTYIKLADGSHEALVEDSAVRAGWSVYFEQWAAAHGLC